uniref:Cdp-diacylglycerol--glycerol-3-phosphate 3-phosphatidyltransferase n=1 Tax=Tetraselmis sp. GSL018 TaxID=582737 RepID=A0A061R3N1_9CHLO|mmetsp:Transcript_2104/g.4979  ORF Transcript_2104/g.4979 Transcript_2104/m.4979 type:complete len:232 (+) Transcript_2104:1426-2121(+)
MRSVAFHGTCAAPCLCRTPFQLRETGWPVAPVLCPPGTSGAVLCPALQSVRSAARVRTASERSSPPNRWLAFRPPAQSDASPWCRVSAALILLANDPPEGISPKEIVLPVVVIISREIGISALREWAAAVGRDAHKAVKVSALGKWKTATQMAAMSTMLFCRRARNVTSDPKHLRLAASAVRCSYYLLVASAVIAVWSLSVYMGAAWAHFGARPRGGSGAHRGGREEKKSA